MISGSLSLRIVALLTPPVPLIRRASYSATLHMLRSKIRMKLYQVCMVLTVKGKILTLYICSTIPKFTINLWNSREFSVYLNHKPY